MTNDNEDLPIGTHVRVHGVLGDGKCQVIDVNEESGLYLLGHIIPRFHRQPKIVDLNYWVSRRRLEVIEPPRSPMGWLFRRLAPMRWTFGRPPL